MTCSDEDRGRSRGPGAEDWGWSHMLGTQWPGGQEVGWFGLKTTRTVFASLASKPVATVSGGLASKPAATVFPNLASKLVATVSPGLDSKLAVSFLFEPQN
jgi:hypothetical protein